MSRSTLMRVSGLLLLLITIYSLKNTHGNFSHFAIASVAVIIFWGFHSIKFSITNIRLVLFIVLIFAAAFYFIEPLSLFSAPADGLMPWTQSSFNPSLLGELKLTHEVAAQRFFDHEPDASERYYKTAVFEQTNNGLHYQEQPLELDRSLMPGTTLWVSEHLKPNSFASNNVEIKNWFRRDFNYSLSPGTLDTAHPLDEFLFKRHKGYCQHFAAALATILKLGGVRARVVVGFNGGTYNSFSNLLTYDMSDAHAWVEAVDPATKQWVRLDPTEWVGFSESSSSHENHLLINFVGAIAFLFLLAALIFRRESDPVAKLLKKIEKFEKKQKLNDRGLTVEERLRRIAVINQKKSEHIQKTIERYEQCYFRGEPTSVSKRELRNSLRW